jgi:type II secretory pathway pseudopilin PulG
MIGPKGRRSITRWVSAVTSGELSQRMNALRSALLALHKAVLAAERAQLERVQGPLGNAEFLQIVSDPLRYGWLKPFTALILAIDDEDDEGEVLAEARQLLKPPKGDTPFGRRYLSLMQRDPTLVVEHRQVTRLL